MTLSRLQCVDRILYSGPCVQWTVPLAISKAFIVLFCSVPESGTLRHMCGRCIRISFCNIVSESKSGIFYLPFVQVTKTAQELCTSIENYNRHHANFIVLDDTRGCRYDAVASDGTIGIMMTFEWTNVTYHQWDPVSITGGHPMNFAIWTVS